MSRSPHSHFVRIIAPSVPFSPRCPFAPLTLSRFSSHAYFHAMSYRVLGNKTVSLTRFSE